MISRERETSEILQGDQIVDSIFTGGIFVYADIVPDDITRYSMPDVFTDEGYIKPFCIIKQRGVIPVSMVEDYELGKQSTVQVVEIWMYEDDGYTNLDAAKSRIFSVLHGKIASKGFEYSLSNIVDRQREMGSLQNKSLVRMDFAVHSVQEVQENMGLLDFENPEQSGLLLFL